MTYIPHNCAQDYLWHPDRAGIITRCTCGRIWRSVHPGNPAYAGWRRVGPLYRRVFRSRVLAAISSEAPAAPWVYGDPAPDGSYLLIEARPGVPPKVIGRTQVPADTSATQVCGPTTAS